MQFVNSRGRLRLSGPGHIYEGVSKENIRTYYNANGGNAQAVSSTTLTIAVAGAAAGDKINFIVSFAGACCLAPLEIDYCLPDPAPATQVDLYADIMEAFATEPSLGGMGSFAVVGTDLVFTAYQPGFDVDFQVIADAAQFTVAGTSVAASPIGESLCPGLAVVIDPTMAQLAADDCTNGVWGIAFAPTQDLSIAASTQKWVGVTLDDDCAEQAPAIGSFPNLSSCDSDCKPRPTCLRVATCGPVRVALETAPDLTAGCELFYRYAVDGDNTTLGAFSMTAGAGLAPVPVGYRVDNVHEADLLADIYFK